MKRKINYWLDDEEVRDDLDLEDIENIVENAQDG